MILAAIDPSYQNTGVAICDEGVWSYFHIKRDKNDMIITNSMYNSFLIAKELKGIFAPYLDRKEELIIGVEYPIMSTRTGSYLSCITSKIDSLFRGMKMPKVVYLPSVACGSFSKARTKTDIVKFVKSEIDPSFKGDHDEATAAILALVARDCIEGKYKHSFFLVDYTNEEKLVRTKTKKK